MLHLGGLKRCVSSIVRLSTSDALQRLPINSNLQRSAALSTLHSRVFDLAHTDSVKTRQFSSVARCGSNFCGHCLTSRFDQGGQFGENDEIWSLTQKRYRWRHKLVRSPPTKPLSFDYAGDKTMSIGPIDLTQPKLGFENIEELQSADENVKKIFSLEFAAKQRIMDKVLHDLLEKVKDHPLDLQSLEVTIARDTVRIRNRIGHCLRFRNDKVSKSRLVGRINRRKKLLADLKSKDIEKFNWICNELQIKYVEEEKFDRWFLSKRARRKKAARNAALALKKKKMTELQKKVEQERVVFEKYRDDELAKIEAELKELGITETKSLQETFEALKLTDMLPKPEPRGYGPRMRLERKFELYAPRKQKQDDEILKANGFVTPSEMPYWP